jgi:hypothetical protein
MQPRQFLSGGCEGGEIGREGNPRQLAFEVGGVALAISRMVEQRVEIVEYAVFGDGVVGVVLAEFGDDCRSPALGDDPAPSRPRRT